MAALAVENGREPVCAEKYAEIDDSGQKNYRIQGIFENRLYIPVGSGSIVSAQQRLDALGDACIEGNYHDRQVGDNSVSRHADISHQPQDNSIKSHNNNSGRKLGNQRRYSC